MGPHGLRYVGQISIPNIYMYIYIYIYNQNTQGVLQYESAYPTIKQHDKKVFNWRVRVQLEARFRNRKQKRTYWSFIHQQTCGKSCKASLEGEGET